MLFEALIEFIKSVVKENHQELITGPELQRVLLEMVRKLGSRQLKGVAYPSTVPGEIEGHSVYIAGAAGYYTHFNLELQSDELALLTYDFDMGLWVKEIITSLHPRQHSMTDKSDHAPVAEQDRGKFAIANELTGEWELRHIAYTHVQGTGSDEWTIQHGLKKRPSVVAVDNYGRVYCGETEYIDDNTIIMRFNAAFSGKAYCN